MSESQDLVGADAAENAHLTQQERARGMLARQLSQIEWLATAYFCGIAGFVSLYSIAEFARLAYALQVLLFNFGVLLGLVVAGGGLGGLLGFLFGIPRSLQGNGTTPLNSGTAGIGNTAETGSSQSQTTGSVSRAFTGNSNLEEISDWLTKIIVGVSLIQAHSIYGLLAQLASTFKAGIPNSQGADVMFALVLVSSLIGGFLFQYLETRTRVMSLFNVTETATTPELVLTQITLQTALETPIGSGRNQGTTPSSSEDEKLLKIPYGALQTADQLAAWSSAQARAGNLQAANQGLRAAIVREPGRKDLLVRLADVLERQGSPDAARALIAEAESKEGDNLALLKRDLLQALYEQPPGSFEKALSISEKLVVRPDGAKDPFVHLWTAAAYGQKFLWLTQNAGSEPEKQLSRGQAIASVRKVVELSPDPKSSARVLLRNLLDPTIAGAAPEDNDLEIFKTDPEFRNLILPE